MNPARAWLWTTALLTATALTCAVVLAPPAGAPPVPALNWLLFTGSSVHVASTAWLFTLSEVRAYAREHARQVPVGPGRPGRRRRCRRGGHRPGRPALAAAAVLRLAVLALPEAEHRGGRTGRRRATGAAA